MRTFGLFALLTFFLACNQDTPSTDGKPAPDAPGKDAEAKEKPETPLATTGISVIQRDHEALGADVLKTERALAAGETIDARLVRGLPKRWRVLDIAARRALAEHTVQDLRMRRARGLQRRTGMERERLEAIQEAASIREMLEDKKKGIADIPEGFTEPELMDKMADEELRARDIKAKIDKLTEELVAMEDLLKQESIEPQGDSIFKREVEDLQGLKARIDALVKGLG